LQKKASVFNLIISERPEIQTSKKDKPEEKLNSNSKTVPPVPENKTEDEKTSLEDQFKPEFSITFIKQYLIVSNFLFSFWIRLITNF
jgi:hypothetical protein